MADGIKYHTLSDRMVVSNVSYPLNDRDISDIEHACLLVERSVSENRRVGTVFVNADRNDDGGDVFTVVMRFSPEGSRPLPNLQD